VKVTTTAIAFALAAAFGAAANAQTTDATVTKTLGGIKAHANTKMYATVLSINTDTREVLLMDQNGKLHNITVGDDVRNLGQVRVGDKINIEYTEAVSIKLKKHGTSLPAASVEDAAIRAPAGAKPGAAVGRQVTALATVVAVNDKDQKVTLRGPMGNEEKVSVTDPEQLKNIKAGDKVEATYTEALAVSVESTPNSQK
jgi:hypothetical protein